MTPHLNIEHLTGCPRCRTAAWKIIAAARAKKINRGRSAEQRSAAARSAVQARWARPR